MSIIYDLFYTKVQYLQPSPIFMTNRSNIYDQTSNIFDQFFLKVQYL